MTRRHVLITEDDMARLRDLIQTGTTMSPRDERHLAELDRELDHAAVVAPDHVPADVVTMHSTVRVRDLDSGARAVYTLVFPADADIARHRISVLAPIGTALIGYRAGDTLEWNTPRGTRRLLIEQVLFQPEAAERR